MQQSLLSLRSRSCLFSGNAAEDSGGALNLFSSTAEFGGNCTLRNNFAAQNGGGLLAYGSAVRFSGEGATVAFRQNAAGKSGGGASIFIGSSVLFNGTATFAGLRPAPPRHHPPPRLRRTPR